MAVLLNFWRACLECSDPSALVALVSEIDKKTARFAITPSFDRAKKEQGSNLALPKLNMLALLRINSILFTNAARALGSVSLSLSLLRSLLRFLSHLPHHWPVAVERDPP